MNNKLCFHIVSHGKLECYDLQAYFFNKFKFIKDYDIIVWDNSGASYSEVESHLKDFKCNVKIFAPMKNEGYFLGQLTAINKCYNLIKNYEYVIHLSVDCFIVDDSHLNDFIENCRSVNAGLLSNQFHFLPETNQYVDSPTACYGSDFFMFNPKILNKEFWDRCLDYGYIPPELILRRVCDEMDKMVMIWTRMHPTIDGRILCAPTEEQRKGYEYRYYADTAGIHHCHNLSCLEKYK
jgi:hypothetical protein